MLLLLLAGFGLSLLGSLPPGLISLAVAYTSIQRGLHAAWWVALGAATVEFGQAWLASALADWFLAHAVVERIFQWAVLPIFLGLGLYMLFWAPTPTPRKSQVFQGSTWRHLGQGAFISLFNLLALPYWFTYCGWLHMAGWWPDSRWSVVVFATGVSLGTISALSLYAWAGQKAVEQSDTVGRIANRVMGVIFLLLAGKLVVDIVVG